MVIESTLVNASLLGLMAGFIAALFGVGGGVVAIPLMILVLGMKPSIAVGTNSVIIIVSTLLSAYFHARQGTLRKEGIYLGLGGAFGTLVGNALFFITAKAGLMKKVLGILFLSVAVLTLYSPKSRSRKVVLGKKGMMILGLFVGVFAALMGMSGGIWLNPILVLLGYDIKTAIGISVAALPLITIVSAIPKVIAGYANLSVALGFIPGLIVGARMGAKLMKASSSRTLRIAFAIFISLVGIRLLIS